MVSLIKLSALAVVFSTAAVNALEEKFMYGLNDVDLTDESSIYMPEDPNAILLKATIPGAHCNDGSPYQAYIRTSASSNWIIMMQGGAWCFDLFSCTERWNTMPKLMSSLNYSSQVAFYGGVMSGNSTMNPVFSTWNMVFLPYCTSDDFSGNSPSNNTPWSYMGSLIPNAIVKYLKANSGLTDSSSTTIVWGGSSAGAEGVLPNLDRVASWFSHAKVVGLMDSGWFLDSVPYYSHNCVDAGTCTEQAGLMKGVPLWNSVMDDDCSQAKGGSNLWECLLGYRAAPYVQTPVFSFNWRFDAAQLGHDGIGENPNKGPANMLQYAQQSAYNLTGSFYNQKQWTYYAASCYCHTVMFNQFWNNLKVGGARLTDALQSFIQNPHTPWNIIDQCNTPNCNPTCPQCGL